MMRPRFAIASAVLALAGCASPTEPGLLQIRTSATVISAGAPDSSRIHFTITNATLAPLHVSRCGNDVSVAVEQWNAGVWTQYSGGFCVLSYYGGPLTLEPGQTYAGVHQVGAVGRFRLKIGAQKDMQTPPEWTSTSNPFEVR